jgi:hypothetical protein
MTAQQHGMVRHQVPSGLRYLAAAMIGAALLFGGLLVAGHTDLVPWSAPTVQNAVVAPSTPAAAPSTQVAAPSTPAKAPSTPAKAPAGVAAPAATGPTMPMHRPTSPQHPEAR